MFYRPEKDKHLRVIYTFKRHNSEQVYNMYYIDSCNYGNITLYRSQTELNTKLNTIGHDLLKTTMTDDQFVELCRKHDTMSFTAFLMDQKYVSGVGNYVKSDTLLLGRINPHAKINQLTDGRLKRYYNRCRIYLEFRCYMRVINFSAMMYISNPQNEQSEEQIQTIIDKLQSLISHYTPIMDAELKLTGDDKIFKEPISLYQLIHYHTTYEDLNGVVYEVVCEKAPAVGGRKTYYVKELVF